MASFPPDSKIREFWAWFTSVARRFEANPVDSATLADLDSRVSEFGEIVWELGPGVNAEHALVLSPDGDPEWLPLTRRIVALAPVVERWEFHPARPPKQWELQFAIDNGHGGTTHIDARPWRYVMLKFPDGTLDVIIEQSNGTGISDDERWLSCIILLDGLLGEATRMAFVGDVEPVLELPPEYAEKATPIERMPAHFDSLLDSATHPGQG